MGPKPAEYKTGREIRMSLADKINSILRAVNAQDDGSNPMIETKAGGSTKMDSAMVNLTEGQNAVNRKFAHLTNMHTPWVRSRSATRSRSLHAQFAR